MKTPEFFAIGRRMFMRDLWTFFVGSSISLAPWSGFLCAKIIPGAGVVRLRINELPPLGTEGGSMRFTAGPLPPLMINRGGGNRFYAMSIVCQHQGCFVPAYNSELGTIQCPCHGSRYAIDGSVLAGPALIGLERFAVSFDGINTLQVLVPGLAFDAKITSVTPVGEGTRRLALSFPAAAFTDYEIYRHAELTAERSPVAFALTPDGEATHKTVRPTSNGDITVYIDAIGSSGFYSVALLMKEYQG